LCGQPIDPDPDRAAADERNYVRYPSPPSRTKTSANHCPSLHGGAVPSEEREPTRLFDG
jgi:hypothetical protein